MSNLLILCGNVYANDFTTSVKVYYNELNKCKTISREHENDLIKRAKKNDLSARNKVLASNLKFVFDVANKYKGYGTPLEELISEGNMGLIKAIDKFDETKGVKFITYAVFWIRQSIQALLKKNQLRGSLFTYESDDEYGTLKKHAENSENDYCGCNTDDCEHFSDMCFDENEDYSDEFDSKELELKKSRDKVVNFLLKTISGRDLEIINLYYGLGDDKPKNLEEIGNMYNISKERVRQICKKNLMKFRSEILKNDDLYLSFMQK